MNKILVTFLVLAVNSAFGFWTPCGDGIHAPHTIISDDCTPEICTVHRGNQLIADVHFISLAVNNRLDVRISTTFLGIPINLEVPAGHENACDHLRGDGCPTVIGRNYIWMINAPILTSYPALSNVIIRGKF